MVLNLSWYSACCKQIWFDFHKVWSLPCFCVVPISFVSVAHNSFFFFCLLSKIQSVHNWHGGAWGCRGGGRGGGGGERRRVQVQDSLYYHWLVNWSRGITVAWTVKNSTKFITGLYSLYLSKQYQQIWQNLKRKCKETQCMWIKIKFAKQINTKFMKRTIHASGPINKISCRTSHLSQTDQTHTQKRKETAHCKNKSNEYQILIFKKTKSCTTDICFIITCKFFPYKDILSKQMNQKKTKNKTITPTAHIRKQISSNSHSQFIHEITNPGL